MNGTGWNSISGPKIRDNCCYYLQSTEVEWTDIFPSNNNKQRKKTILILKQLFNTFKTTISNHSQMKEFDV